MPVSWENISGNWSTWITDAYTGILGNWFWPIVFFGVIGYVYTVNKSATAAAVAICILFGVFGVTGIFTDAPEYVMLNATIVIIAIAGTFTAIFMRKK